MMLQKVTYVYSEVHGCARCGADHNEALTFSSLPRPVRTLNGACGYWAMCPNGAGPILMNMVSTDARTEEFGR